MTNLLFPPIERASIGEAKEVHGLGFGLRSD